MIVSSRGSTGLYQIPATGGEPKQLLRPEAGVENDIHEPRFLPDGRSLIFVVHRTAHGPDSLTLLSGTTRKVLLQYDGQTIWHPVYSPTGHILFWRNPTNSGLWALPFSLSRLEVTGEPFLVVPDANYPSVADDGTLLYVRRAGSVPLQLVWVDRSGKVLGAIGEPQQDIRRPSLSPDGRRVAAIVIQNGEWDLWSYDLQRGTRTRLTFTPTGQEWDPAWTPNGKEIVYVGEGKLLRISADGTGKQEPVATGASLAKPVFSADGKFIVYVAQGPDAKGGLWYLPLGGEPKPVAFAATPEAEGMPSLSPDGRYVAYVSTESGRQEVYITKVPGGEGKWQVSVNGGTLPHWRGARLLYREGDSLMEVQVSTQPSLVLSAPKRLFSTTGTGLEINEPYRYDVDATGQRFLMMQQVRSETRSPAIAIVQNWFAEFQDKQKK